MNTRNDLKHLSFASPNGSSLARVEVIMPRHRGMAQTTVIRKVAAGGEDKKDKKKKGKL